jgi:hypothetical protein
MLYKVNRQSSRRCVSQFFTAGPASDLVISPRPCELCGLNSFPCQLPSAIIITPTLCVSFRLCVKIIISRNTRLAKRDLPELAFVVLGDFHKPWASAQRLIGLKSNLASLLVRFHQPERASVRF